MVIKMMVTEKRKTKKVTQVRIAVKLDKFNLTLSILNEYKTILLVYLIPFYLHKYI